MLSIPDMALLGAAALLLFGPEQLPKVMRKAGHVMREVQNTSQTFIREMERAADVHAPEGAPPTTEYDPGAWQPIDEPPFDESAVGEKLAEPSPALALAPPAHGPALEPPEPDPEPVVSPAAQRAPQGEHSANV